MATTNNDTAAAPANTELNEKYIAAVEKGDVAAMTELLTQGANISAEDQFNNKPLHIAAMRNLPAVVSFLLERNAEIDMLNADDNTALLLASNLCYTELVAQLVKAGARVTAVDLNGTTALHWVSMGGDLASAQLLVESKADPNAACSDKTTPLHPAASQVLVHTHQHHHNHHHNHHHKLSFARASLLLLTRV